jgi:hypothetical protein
VDHPGLTSGQSQAANCQGAHFRDAVEITIDVDHAEAVVKSRLGDQEVWNRRPVPHPMMVGEILLEMKGSVKDVRWRGDELEVGPQIRLELVVVPG